MKPQEVERFGESVGFTSQQPVDSDTASSAPRCPSGDASEPPGNNKLRTQMARIKRDRPYRFPCQSSIKLSAVSGWKSVILKANPPSGVEGGMEGGRSRGNQMSAQFLGCATEKPCPVSTLLLGGFFVSKLE